MSEPSIPATAPSATPTSAVNRPPTAGRPRKLLCTIISFIGAAIVCTSASVVLASSPALAHDQLVSETPGDGASVQSVPEEVTLEFSGSPQKLGNEIEVLHNGENVAAGDPEAQFHTISQKLHADLSPGDYTVKWRVVSEDGHPVSGQFSFTIAAEKTQDSDAGGTGDPSSPASPSSSEAPPSAAAGSQSTAIVTAITVTAVIVIGAATAFAVRTRRQRK